MEFLLKARRPEKYGERKRFQHSGEIHERITLTPEQEAEELASWAAMAQSTVQIARGPDSIPPPAAE
jgi:hypothetical protein